MRTDRSVVAELVMYGAALWLSYEMAKTPQQRRSDRLRFYTSAARTCWRAARCVGKWAMVAELAYWREIDS